MPNISVILPTYARNKNGMLSAAIRSVLDQTYDDLELLICDDGSTDGSAETIRQFAAVDSRVKHIRFEQNVGLPAFTTGVAANQAQGAFIAWQFDDCEWFPHLLESLLNSFDEHPNAGLIYGRALIDGSGGRFTGDAFDLERLSRQNFIPNNASLVRRKVYDTVGWVDPNVLLKRTNDWDLWLRASRKFQIHHIPVALSLEKGPMLEDSLGRSVTANHELMLRYFEVDRDDYLSLSNMDNWKPFSLPESMTLSDAERDSFILTLAEHFDRVGKSADMIPYLRQAMSPTHELYDVDLAEEPVRLAKWLHRTAVRDLRGKLMDAQALAEARFDLCMVRLSICDSRLEIIEDQRKILEDQQCALQERQAELDLRNKEILRQDDLIADFRRRLKYNPVDICWRAVRKMRRMLGPPTRTSDA